MERFDAAWQELIEAMKAVVDPADENQMDGYTFHLEAINDELNCFVEDQTDFGFSQP